MRTTLTLNDDVAVKIKKRCRETGKTFKDVINEALRMGLSLPRNVLPTKSFTVKARALRARPGMQMDNIGDLLEQIEEK